MWRETGVDEALVAAEKERVEEMMDRLKRAVNGTYGKTREPKNLVVFNEEKLFVWQPEEGCLYCCLLTSEASVRSVQALALTNPPLFAVDSLLFSPTARYLAVTGSRGINVLELPRKWGPHHAYEGGKSTLIARSWTLNERFFVCNQRVLLLDSAWHPASESETHIVLLTNDNTLRIMDVTNPQESALEIKLNPSPLDTSHSLGVSRLSLFAQSLGETAVSFDFGPPVGRSEDEGSNSTRIDRCLWPVYILQGNGDVLLVYTSLENEYLSNRILGPLTMLPPAEDNYGADACKLVCLDSVPPVLIVATSSGLLHHCVALEGNDEDDRLLLSNPVLHVYESVELTLSLTTCDDQSEILSPMRIYKDPVSNDRYFCTHGAGVHAIHLPLVSQLKASSLDSEHLTLQSLVEHLVCTKAIASSCSESCAPLGLSVSWFKGNTSLTFMLTSGLILTQKLSPAVVPPMNLQMICKPTEQSRRESLPEVQFSEHISHILKRSTNAPLLKSKSGQEEPTSGELLQLLLNSTEIFKEEYCHKLSLASEAMEKRVKLLNTEKSVQTEEIGRCSLEKEALIGNIKALTTKYDMALEHNQQLSKRLDAILERLERKQPELSDAEKAMKNELEAIVGRLDPFRNRMNQIKNKLEYQAEVIQLEAQPLPLRELNSSTFPRLRGSGPSKDQIKSILKILENEGCLIHQLLERVNCHRKPEGDRNS